MKRKLQWLVLTKYGRLILSLFLTVTFQVLSYKLDNDILGWIGLVFFAYVIVFSLIMFAYALVINPIRSLKNKKPK